MRRTPGAAIRRARERAGLTQADVAKKLKVTRSAVGQWEREKTEISVARMLELCEALDADVSDFLSDEWRKDGKEKYNLSLIRQDEISIDPDGTYIGASVGGNQSAIITLADLLVETGLLKKEAIADRLYRYAKRAEDAGLLHKAEVIDEIGGAIERTRPKDQFISEGSPDLQDAFAPLKNQIQSLEASYRAVQFAFLTVARLLAEREPLTKSLRVEANKLRRNRDAHGQRALEQLANEVDAIK